MKLTKQIGIVILFMTIAYISAIVAFLVAHWAVRYPWQNWVVVYLILGAIIGLRFVLKISKRK